MVLRRTFLVFLLCTLQLSVICDDCKSNPHKAAEDYATKHKNYMDYVTGLRAKHLVTINKYLSEMKHDPKCIERNYTSFSGTDYAFLGYQVCGVYPLRHNYEPPLKHDPHLSDQEICDFLKVNGVAGLDLIKQNTIIMRTCKADEWFKKVFYKIWKECHETSSPVLP